MYAVQVSPDSCSTDITAVIRGKTAVIGKIFAFIYFFVASVALADEYQG